MAFADAEEPGVEVEAVFRIFCHIFFFDPEHDMKEGPVDAGLGDLTGFQQFAELAVVEKIVKPCGNACGQFF